MSSGKDYTYFIPAAGSSSVSSVAQPPLVYVGNCTETRIFEGKKYHNSSATTAKSPKLEVFDKKTLFKQFDMATTVAVSSQTRKKSQDVASKRPDTLTVADPKFTATPDHEDVVVTLGIPDEDQVIIFISSNLLGYSSREPAGLTYSHRRSRL
jgi:hypothetical protein